MAKLARECDRVFVFLFSAIGPTFPLRADSVFEPSKDDEPGIESAGSFERFEQVRSQIEH